MFTYIEVLPCPFVHKRIEFDAALNNETIQAYSNITS